MEPRLDVEALSERGPANISANSAAFAALFASLADGARFYSGAMLSIALLAPLARVAPRRLAWGFLVVCGLLVAALPANAEEPAPALAAGLLDQVRSLALDKAAAPTAARVAWTAASPSSSRLGSTRIFSARNPSSRRRRADSARAAAGSSEPHDA